MRRKSDRTGRTTFSSRHCKFEQLERREMMDAALGAVLSSFNAGIEKFRANADRFAIEAWSTDIVDIPLLKDQPANAFGLGAVLQNSVPGRVANTDSIDQALNELTQQGYVVDYFGLTPNQAGNLLEVHRAVDAHDLAIANAKFGGGESFSYLNSAIGELTGAAKIKIDSLTGTWHFFVDAAGFEIGADSTVVAKVSADGKVAGDYQIGVLKDVKSSGTAKLSANLSFKLRDANHDGKLTLGEIMRDANVLGHLIGNIVLQTGFDTNLPGLTSTHWSGTFTGQLNDKSLKLSQNFIAPDYNAIAKAAGVEFIGQIRNTQWFASLEGVLGRKIPGFDKSLGEMLGINNKIGDGLALLDVSYLTKTQATQAMQSLMNGQLVNFLHFDHDGSIPLPSGDLIPPVTIADVEWIPGVVGVKLLAILRADASFTYSIHAGVNTLGVYFDTDSKVGINGVIQGGVEGQLNLLDALGALKLTVVKVDGTLALDTTITVAPWVAGGGTRLQLADVHGSLSDNLHSYIDVDAEGRLKGTIDLGTINLGFKKIHLSKSKEWTLDIANLIHAEIWGPESNPPLPATNNVVNVSKRTASNLRTDSPTSRHVTLAWDAADGQTQQVIVGSADDGQTWTAMSDVLQPGTTSATLAVEPSRHYSLRVVSLDGDETGTASDSTDITTPNEAPKNLHVLAVGPTEADLAWDELDGEKNYRVEVSTDGGNSWRLQENVPGDHAFKDTVTLTPGTNYLFRVIAEFAYGDSLPSNIVAVNTPSGIPSSPSNLRVLAVRPAEADLAWDEVDGEKDYTVQVSTDGGNSWHQQENVPADHAYHDTVSLQPGRSYQFRVVANSNFGSSDPSSVVTVNTPSDAPQNLHVLAVGTTSADLAWNEVDGEGNYRVEVSTDGGGSWHPQENVPADHGYKDTVTLKPGSSYLFRVIAVFAYGDSAPSNVVAVNTPADTKPGPTHFHTLAVRATEIDLAWNEVAGEKSYTVQVSTDGVTWKTQENVPADHGYKDTVTVKPGKKYWFRVVANFDSGVSDPSNVIEVTTPKS